MYRRAVSVVYLQLLSLASLAGLGCNLEHTASGDVALYGVDWRGAACPTLAHPTPAQILQAPNATGVVLTTSESTILCIAPSPRSTWFATEGHRCESFRGESFVDATPGVFYGCPSGSGTERWCPISRSAIPSAELALRDSIARRPAFTRGVWFDGVDCRGAPADECRAFVRAMVRLVRAEGLRVGGNINPTNTLTGLTGDDRFDVAVVEMTNDAPLYFVDRVSMADARELVAALPVRTSPPGRRGIALQHPHRGAQAFAMAAAIGRDVAVILTGAPNEPHCIDGGPENPDGFPCWGKETVPIPFVHRRVTDPCEIEPDRFHAYFEDGSGDVFWNHGPDTWTHAGWSIPAHSGLVCVDGSCSQALDAPLAPPRAHDAGLPPPPPGTTPTVSVRGIEPGSPVLHIGDGESRVVCWSSTVPDVHLAVYIDGGPFRDVRAHAPASGCETVTVYPDWPTGLAWVRAEVAGAVAETERFTVACSGRHGTSCGGLGACQGLVTCNGACGSAGVPSPEICGNPVDENCDGIVASCAPAAPSAPSIRIGDARTESAGGYGYADDTGRWLSGQWDVPPSNSLACAGDGRGGMLCTPTLPPPPGARYVVFNAQFDGAYLSSCAGLTRPVNLEDGSACDTTTWFVMGGCVAARCPLR